MAITLAALPYPRTTLGKRTGLIAGCLLLFWANALAAEQVRVMQWNIHGNLGNINSNSTAAAKAIARIVNYSQPDVLLFNELEDTGVAAATTALINWATNNVAYLGAQPGVTFFVAVSSRSDGFNRNGAISRYPILNATTYNDGMRGLHAFTVQLATTNLRVFHAHLKCCSDGTSCTTKQAQAQFDSDAIKAFAATNSLPYIFGGDWNEDEGDPMCSLSSTYHPITTIRTNGGLVEFKPTTLSGNHLTWSSASTPSIRFDYILAATNRLSPVSGFVFSTMDWAAHGLYTNASPQNLVNDSKTASDHYCVFADYAFLAPTPSLAVSPAGSFTSTGNEGGPFSPASRTYTLTNSGSGSLNWTATMTADWLTLSATTGTLAAGASTNVTASVNANANSLAASTYSDTVSFTNSGNGMGNTARPVSLIINPLPPVALFTGNPISGAEPLTVTFSDASTGDITNRLWFFGDVSTTNTAATNVTHVYAAGTYDVTLVATGPGGASTNSQPGYITVLTPFQSWQVFYFGSATNTAAAPNADFDHDGMGNWSEFLAGTNPTNSASALRITSVAQEGDDLRVSWTMGSGKTNVLQRADGLDGTGSFTDVFTVFATDSVTNYLDVGAAMNAPARYYRVRLGF